MIQYLSKFRVLNSSELTQRLAVLNVAPGRVGKVTEIVPITYELNNSFLLADRDSRSRQLQINYKEISRLTS